MKFYIAARFSKKEQVREIYKKLAEKGHEVHTDWTVHKPIYPYSSDKKLASQYAQEDLNGASGCDVFVLLADEFSDSGPNKNSTGRGMFIEFGAAILSSILNGSPRVFVIGPDNDKAIFHFHPNVTRKNTIDEVLNEIA